MTGGELLVSGLTVATAVLYALQFWLRQPAPSPKPAPSSDLAIPIGERRG